MKQKIVIKVQINCEKCRSKALKLAASADGVNAVAIEGEDKNHVMVVGEGVDAATLTRTLRKKVGHADIIGVEEVKKKVEKESKPEAPKVEHCPVQWYPNCPPPSRVVLYDEWHDASPNVCSVM